MDGIDRPGCGFILMPDRSASKLFQNSRKGSLDRIAEGSALRRPGEAGFVFGLPPLTFLPVWATNSVIACCAAESPVYDELPRLACYQRQGCRARPFLERINREAAKSPTAGVPAQLGSTPSDPPNFAGDNPAFRKHP